MENAPLFRKAVPDEPIPMSTRRELANAIRALAMDAVEKAASGHPGAPMGMADVAEVLWRQFLKVNPSNPSWFDRDRFVLSMGHASMLLYSVLHLTGFPISLDELKRFRQLGSRTPGHPEYELAAHDGVETTTGPLGQGLGNAVGMALAEKLLAAQFNKPGLPIVDHYTYVFASDGDLMEGVSHEASSLAGTLKLGKLIVFYDDNGISIDGRVQGWFRDDTPKRFEAYHWHAVPDVDGHDADAVIAAIRAAQAVTDRPSIICTRTVIGWGAPNKQGTKSTHGEPLGAAEVAAARQQLGWKHEPFDIPEDLRREWDLREKGAAVEAEWNGRFARYGREYPELAAEFERRMRGELPESWRDTVRRVLEAAAQQTAPQATRQSSQLVINTIGTSVPELLGGSADLTGSNNTLRKDARPVTPEDASGAYIYYGVREFGMHTAMNGIALHGGFIPFGGTFLVFSDYARNAVRLAALMHVRVILVYTHDSIGLGEDGPTHQPVEHLPSLRAMPNLSLWRPCDATETAVAWAAAIERANGPTALVLTRQALPQQPRTPEQQAAIRRGAYVLIDAPGGPPECIVIATGSEVAIAAQAVQALNASGRRVRLVSVPSTDAFDAQDAAYRESVLPRAVQKRLAGCEGRVLGLDRFGASGKGAELFAHFGFTADNVQREIESLLKA